MKKLHITLPDVPPPVVDGYVGAFVPFVRTGNLIPIVGAARKRGWKALVRRQFLETQMVANGASELFIDVFEERGAHARSAVGVAQIPFGCCVEIEMVVETLGA